LNARLYELKTEIQFYDWFSKNIDPLSIKPSIVDKDSVQKKEFTNSIDSSDNKPTLHFQLLLRNVQMDQG
jgi:hypothetical protein